ncbi:PAS domain-containing protein [Melittangium boletus]|uniref:PAS domain-containing protein n=1 Tax=Melittangium boletus TaxID=83453 RepID=UPI003DA3CA26
MESAIDFAVIAADLDGRITHWNEGARRILGWTPEEIRGQPLHRLFTEEDRAQGVPERELRQAREEGRALDERWHVRADGSRFWASGELTRLKDDAGTVVGFVKVLRDRTAHRALEQERERFLRLAEQSADFVGIADLDGRGVFLNPAGRRLVGLGEADTGGCFLSELFLPEEQAIARDVILPALHTQGQWRGELRLRHQGSGEAIPVDCNAFVLRDAAGQLSGYATITRDISGSKRAESALRWSEERVRLALSASGSVGIWDWHITADRVHVEAHFARLYALPPEAVARGVSLESFLSGIHPEDREQVRQEAWRAVEADTGYDAEYRLLDGQRWVHARGRVYRDAQGRPERMAGTLVDTTARKATELRQVALLDLSDRFRDLTEPGDIASCAAELLGRTLGLSRAGFAVVDLDSRTLRIEQDWSNGQVDRIMGAYPFAAFGAAMERMLRGLPAIEKDVEAAAWIPAEELSNYRALGKRGFVKLPFMRQEQLAGFVFGHSTVPRDWSDADVGFMREVASRTWEAMERALAERAVHERELDLRLLTDEAPEMIGYLDRDLRYLFINDTYEEWFGMPRARILGASVSELLGEEAFALREPYFRRALAGEAVHFEAPLDLPGIHRDLELRFFPRRDLKGTIQGVYTFVLDITERKRTERVLREANEQLEQRVAARTLERDRIWRNSAELMGVAGLDGYLKSINPAWSRLLGVGDAELLARPFLEFIHPGDHAAVKGALAQLTQGERLARFEDRLLRADGTERVVAWTAVPGDDVFYVIGRDVTAERENEALQRRLFDVLDASPDFVGIADAMGRVVYVNATGRRMVGLADLAEVRRSYVLDYFVPEDRARIENEAIPTVLREGRWEGRCTFRHFTSGKTTPVQYNVFVTRDAAGAVVGLGTVTRDITVQLQQEEALSETEARLRQSQKMESVGQLTGGIAHDFNNLLGGIMGSMEMLKRRLEAGRYAETDKYIQATMASAQRAAALTARLLAFGRRQSLDVKPAELNTLVSSMADLLRRTLGEHVDLKILLEPRPWLAMTDANQFENALLNLAINARDAMPSGGLLTVETSNSRLDESYTRGFEGLKPGEYVVLSVSDTGQGMSPEVLARAFEPFFTTKPIGQGTGLGLSMIYGFARQVGGHVRIYSEEGRGTTVKLFTPRYVGAGVGEAESAPRIEPPRARGERVLVVEDEPAVRMLVMEILEDLGYAALEAPEARAALGLLEQADRVDLLVTDVGLPGGMNGRQLAEVARQRRPGLKVLFITGYAEGASVRGGFLAPGMEMITKPFALDALAARIREMIERPPEAPAPSGD